MADVAYQASALRPAQAAGGSVGIGAEVSGW